MPDFFLSSPGLYTLRKTPICLQQFYSVEETEWWIFWQMLEFRVKQNILLFMFCYCRIYAYGYFQKLSWQLVCVKLLTQRPVFKSQREITQIAVGVYLRFLYERRETFRAVMSLMRFNVRHTRGRSRSERRKSLPELSWPPYIFSENWLDLINSPRPPLSGFDSCQLQW